MNNLDAPFFVGQNTSACWLEKKVRFSVGSGLHVNLGYIKTIEASNTDPPSTGTVLLLNEKN